MVGFRVAARRYCIGSIGKLRSVNLMGLSEYLCLLGNLIVIKFGNLVHLLDLLNVALDF